MAKGDVGHYVRTLENISNHNHILQSMLEPALSLASFAVGPPIPSLLL